MAVERGDARPRVCRMEPSHLKAEGWEGAGTCTEVADGSTSTIIGLGEEPRSTRRREKAGCDGAQVDASEEPSYKPVLPREPTIANCIAQPRLLLVWLRI